MDLITQIMYLLFTSACPPDTNKLQDGLGSRKIWTTLGIKDSNNKRLYMNIKHLLQTLSYYRFVYINYGTEPL